jgi:hypothetical protein
MLPVKRLKKTVDFSVKRKKCISLISSGVKQIEQN